MGKGLLGQSGGCSQAPGGAEPPALGIACGASYSYAPLIADHVPIKTVRIALHSFQNDSGGDNFRSDNVEHMAYLAGAITSINNRLGNLGELIIGDSPYIQDSRVRVVVVAFYEHMNTAVMDVPNANSQYDTYVLQDASGYGMTAFDKEQVQHVFLTGSVTPGSCCAGRASAIGGQGWILSAGWYEHYLANGATSYTWSIPGHFIHELGHSMSLSHNYTGAYGICDQCTDNDFVPGGPCPTIGTSNNFMDVRGPSGSVHGYNASNPNPGLSACQLGRIHYYLEGNAGTIWRTVADEHCSYHPDEGITIQQDATWLSSKKLKGDLVIEPGATLTIQCRVHIPVGGKIVVRQGAKLIVDEGEITNLCGDFWQGIEVWGTTDQYQYPSNAPTHQGLLILKNGGTVEHAREGVTNWRPDDWNSIGGVIQVQGSPEQIGGTFLNCRRAVQFMAYQNFAPGNPNILMPNASYFKYADFIVDDDYRGGDDFFSHVSMWRVDGINFTACNFENAQTTISKSSNLGTGINSIDASYKVLGHCTMLLPYGQPCPEEHLDKGTFSGLDHGIQALSGSLGGYGFTADQLEFKNNVLGVYAGGVPATITRNNFTIGDRDVTMDHPYELASHDAYHRGIFTQQSTSFRIEDNKFFPAANVIAEGIAAILIANSGPNNLSVFNNEATGMSQGYVGEGECNDHSQASTIGLQFLCNKNNGNEYNIWARPNPMPEISGEAIRAQQGSNAKPAANTFDQDLGVPLESDFRNEAPETPLNYWWQVGTGTEPMDITPGWVGKTLAAGPNGWCVSKFVEREIGLEPGLEAQVANEMDAAKTAYVTTAYVYNSLLDGGNTDGLIAEVQETWPGDAWELRASLLAKSPFLSTEVLKEMMVKHIMPQAMELEICLANPEATRKEGFIKWVEHEAPYPMPGYMIDLFAGSWEGKTFRMQLEAEMAQHHADMSDAAQLLQASYAVEEDSIPLGKMLGTWQAMPNYGARYAEAGLYLRQNNFAAAQAVIEDLPENYPTKGREQEQARTLWYIQQLRNLASAGKNVMQMDSARVAVWEAFARERNDLPGNWAANVLCYGYDRCIVRGGGNGGTQKALRPVHADRSVQDEPTLLVHPNPASTWVAMSYRMQTRPNEARVRILDAQGRTVYAAALTAKEGQQIWDTRNTPAGVYSVELFNAGKRLDVQRVIIQSTER